MKTSLIVRFAALSTSAVITMTLLQAVALLGHPRPAAESRVATTVSLAAPAH